MAIERHKELREASLTNAFLSRQTSSSSIACDIAVTPNYSLLWQSKVRNFSTSMHSFCK